MYCGWSPREWQRVLCCRCEGRAQKLPPWQNHYFFFPPFSYIKWKLVYLSCFKILAQLRLLCLVKFIYLLACFVNWSQTLNFTLAETLILLGSLHPVKWASTKTTSKGQMTIFWLLFRVFDGNSKSWLSLYDTLAWQFWMPQVICSCMNAKIKSQKRNVL